jgi:hypothetical protein
MGVYVDAEDLLQHFRQGQGLDEESIEEIMSEQEDYVQERLKLDVLPPSNNIVKSIVRDLTIAKCIYELTPINVDQLAKADSQERSALRKLGELEREGSLKTRDSSNLDKEVFSPYPPYFSPTEFGL